MAVLAKATIKAVSKNAVTFAEGAGYATANFTIGSAQAQTGPVLIQLSLAKDYISNEDFGTGTATAPVIQWSLDGNTWADAVGGLVNLTALQLGTGATLATRVKIFDDSKIEGTENFRIVAEAAGGNIQGSATTSVRITDNDTNAVLKAAKAVVTAAEGAYAGADFTITKSLSQTGSVTVKLALAKDYIQNQDFILGTTGAPDLEYSFDGGAFADVPTDGLVTLNLNVAKTALTLTTRVKTTEDTTVEGQENFRIVATADSGNLTGSGSTTVRVTDNDSVAAAATLSAAKTSATTTEGGYALADFNIKTTAAQSAPVEILLAVAKDYIQDQDFGTGNGSAPVIEYRLNGAGAWMPATDVSLPSLGANSTTVVNTRVKLFDDAAVESQENFRIVASVESGNLTGSGSTTVRVNDNDTGDSHTYGSIPEDSGVVSFKVSDLALSDGSVFEQVNTFTGGVAVYNAETQSIDFTPTANFNGPAVINYQVLSGSGTISTGQIKFDVTPVNDPPSGSVSISSNGIPGLTVKNDVLSASNSLVDVEGKGTVTYHWLRDGQDFGTATFYTVKASDVGHSIAVTASYTDLAGNLETVTSAPVGIVNLLASNSNANTLTGTTGVDVFRFTTAGASNLGALDTITGFDSGNDKIDLRVTFPEIDPITLPGATTDAAALLFLNSMIGSTWSSFASHKAGLIAVSSDGTHTDFYYLIAESGLNTSDLSKFDANDLVIKITGEAPVIADLV